MPGYALYTERERNFITENYLKLSDTDIALRLNRTRVAIYQERCKMRLFRPVLRTVRSLFNKEVDEVIKLRNEWHLIQEMKALIIMCELEKNTFKKEKYKEELKKLSGIK